MSDFNNKNFILNQALWLGISLAISIAISLVVPFPYSLPIIIGVFLLLSFYIRQRQFKKLGLSSATMFGNSSSVNYYCMNCGAKHNQVSCPRCGSKMKRVGA
ncbi:MAG TPA: hypothetical protein VEW92_12380 [Nitrososphaeraceae archaeon]|jgi:hypothetical protein|nr:hypothetical protein [Nitrososphaeraceae archaeon]